MMFCKSPISFRNGPTAGLPFACGQCLPCRINKRRVWTARMMLEASTAEASSFLTLTYADLPGEWYHPDTGRVWDAGSLNPAHWNAFIKRFRRVYGPVRFYMCGEYGDKTSRPHYHAALFGYPACAGPGAQTINGKFVPCVCRNCSTISKCWGRGHIYLGTLTQDSAQYVCGYVTKKLTQDNDYVQTRLGNRHPEFQRVSRMPGLGYEALSLWADRLRPYVKLPEDVPSQVLIGAKKWPLGRYMTDKLHKFLGFTPDPEDFSAQKLASQKKVSAYGWSLLAMLKDAVPVALAAGGAAEKRALTTALSSGSLPLLIQHMNAQRVHALEKRQESVVLNHKEKV